MWILRRLGSRFFRCLWAPRTVDRGADRDPSGDDEPDTGGTPRQQELRRAVWRLRRAYTAVAGDGTLGELAGLFRGLASQGGNFRETVVAWIDVVEVLVQDVEQLETARAGRGARKKKLVKSALVHLLARYSVREGREPFLLEPFVYEAVADVSIDTVVRLINRNDLWQSIVPLGGSRGGR